MENSTFQPKHLLMQNWATTDEKFNGIDAHTTTYAAAIMPSQLGLVSNHLYARLQGKIFF